LSERRSLRFNAPHRLSAVAKGAPRSQTPRAAIRNCSSVFWRRGHQRNETPTLGKKPFAVLIAGDVCAPPRVVSSLSR
jgi:hypothetical protein